MNSGNQCCSSLFVWEELFSFKGKYTNLWLKKNKQIDINAQAREGSGNIFVLGNDSCCVSLTHGSFHLVFDRLWHPSNVLVSLFSMQGSYLMTQALVRIATVQVHSLNLEHTCCKVHRVGLVLICREVSHQSTNSRFCYCNESPNCSCQTCIHLCTCIDFPI